MSKWHMIVDVAKCENCCNCFLAVKDEYCGNTFPGYSAEQPRHGHRWLDIKQVERGSGSLLDVAYLPTTCNQCEDAPCVKAAKNDAVTVRDDGIVMIDPVKAQGQRQLVDACPYGHIWWNEEEQLPQKWSFDAHLLDAGWTRPRPASVCATGAMRMMKCSDEEFADVVRAEGLEALNPEFGTRPRILYKNLYRYRDAFIAGSVAEERKSGVECLVGAEVSLFKDDVVVGVAVTDGFGDFKFDRLDKKSGKYVVKIHHEGHLVQTLSVNLEDSVYLGEILVSRVMQPNPG